MKAPPSLIPLEEAIRRVLVDVERLPGEEVALAAAAGRVLEGDVASALDLPPLDNSAMDGFAVRAEDTAGAPVHLLVREVVPAGAVPQVTLGPGDAARIMTGAPLPPGADAVVPFEEVTILQDRVEVPRPVPAGRHVRPAGEDVRAGSTVLTAGTTLTPARLGLLAALGLDRVAVVRRPRVGVLATGDEVVPPGAPLPPGAVWSSNSVTLEALAREAGATPVDLGIAGDEPGELAAAFRRAGGVDVLVTTGGASMGDRDRVREVLAEAGAVERFWGVAMQPGKPVSFALLDGRRVFSLPGNPTSAAVTFLQLVRPLIRVLLGDPAPFLPVVAARAGEAVPRRPGRAWLERVRLERDPSGGIVAWRSGGRSSGAISPLARAHGLLLLGGESTGVAAGDPVRVQVLDWGFLDGGEPGYGW